MAQEKNFENRVKDFMKTNGSWFVKYWSGGVPTKQGIRKFTKDGIPDILACVGGQFVGIELKAPNGRPTQLQMYNLKRIDQNGGMGILLYPKDFDRFKILFLLLKQGEFDEAQRLYQQMKGW